jgi:hypothetical protein
MGGVFRRVNYSYVTVVVLCSVSWVEFMIANVLLESNANFGSDLPEF